MNSQTNGPGVQIAAEAQLANEPSKDRDGNGAQFFVSMVAILFFATTTATSWLRWANFQYRTFDLAYYVQAVWQLIHSRLDVSVENVPLLGNHVEPIIFLFAPFFAIVRHPMLFVVVQNAALASMGPIGYRIARRAGFQPRNAALLAGALLLAPATGYVALHEFHPEALTAPLLLLMLSARFSGKLWLHWVGFFAVLACKENMALLLSAYCIVFLIIERRSGMSRLVRWYGAPLFFSMVWFFLCTKVITPAFNSGNIDYLSLYDRLGRNATEIVWNGITNPQMVGRALSQSLSQGNLIWAVLLPFAGLPLLRLRWLLIACPILLQHLLSWRSSEWNIFFHYAAPILPLFWIGAVEGLSTMRDRWPVPAGVVAAAPVLLVLSCFAAQLWIGPAPATGSELLNQSAHRADRAHKKAFVAQIPADASVVAPLPYLSHLAMREKLYSLHYILKGLKTLSRERYQPPPQTDFVLIDYEDSATFDATAGYYHPQMRTADGRVIPSSDRLLHDFLVKSTWSVRSMNALTLLQKKAPNESESVSGQNLEAPQPGVFQARGNELRSIQFDPPTGLVSGTPRLNFELTWRLDRSREVFPWMILAVGREGQPGIAHSVLKGLCAIEMTDGTGVEHWTADLSELPSGAYWAEATFLGSPTRAWAETHGGATPETGFLGSISLGRVFVAGELR